LFLSDDQLEIPLISAINAVTPSIKDRYFFPGHCGGEYAPKSLKRLYGQDLLQYDLPELDGLDNIHCPEGPLLRALQLASELFGAKQTWFLVNGSTSGILSAIMACVQMHQQRQLNFQLNKSNLDDYSVDDTSANQAVDLNNNIALLTQPKRSVMLLGRDSHKASFDGLRLADCDGALLPCLHDDNFGIPLGVDLTYISEALDTYGSQVCGFLLTRPSYQGVMCSSADLRQIVTLCHSKGVPVIVDEAHGSHLRFLERSELGDALSCGVDIVIQSSHKTLTALSQAAMMHLGNEAFLFPQNNGIQNDSKSGEDLNEIDGGHSVGVSIESEGGLRGEIGEAKLCGEVLHECFSLLTTTSPNTALLASLDATRAQMASEGVQMIQRAAKAADEIRFELRQQNLKRVEGHGDDKASGVCILDDTPNVTSMKNKKIASSEFFEHRKWFIDPLRLTVRFPGRSALSVDDKMCEERGLYCELNLDKCISYGIPPGSDSKSLKKLRKALLDEGEGEIEDIICDSLLNEDSIQGGITYLHTNAAKNRQSIAISLKTEKDAMAAIGRISAETVCPYPPGIPVLIKGEQVTLAHVASLAALRSTNEDNLNTKSSSLGSGCTITGASDQTLQTIKVVSS